MKKSTLVVCIAVLAAGIASAQGPSGSWSDDFSGGTLDTSKWDIAARSAPCAKTCDGFYSPKNVDLSQGMLRLTLTQERGKSGRITNTGAEIKSKSLFGYGKYSYVMRVATTSSTASGTGNPVSGSVTAGWNYKGDSQTEIDFEILGSEPDNVYMTSWHNLTSKAPTTFNQQAIASVSGLGGSFHKFDFVWKPGSIEFYIDGKYISTHTKKVPAAPANIVVCLWGNDSHWGGKATPDVTRYMFVKSVTYTPLR